MQGSVPHSGNECSGLCVTPCGHATCWQCMEVKESPQELIKSTKKRLQTLVNDHNFRRVRPTGLLANLPAQAPKDHQKTTITRAALEELAAKAGIAMDWNDGEPIFRDGGKIKEMEGRYNKAERDILEQKVKELERIAGQQRQGILSQQAANSMAKAAAQQMDTMVSDILQKQVNETLVEDLRANEASAKAKLKEQGASDEDIAAAEALLGWKPEGEDHSILNPEPPKMGLYDTYLKQLQSAAGLNDLLNGSAPRTMLSSAAIQNTIDRAVMAQLRAKLPHLQPGNYIVHPDLFKDLKFPVE